MKKLFVLLLFQLILFGCFKKRTWLSDEIKKIVPYREGQTLVFESNTGLQDSLRITRILDRRFPDGIGAPSNERLAVVAHGQSRSVRDGTEEIILYLTAPDGEKDEEIQFEFSLRETFMYSYNMTLPDYKAKTIEVLESRFGRHEDVLKIVLPEKVHMSEKAVRQIYWSKSLGYVRLIQNDSTIWDLKKITTVKNAFEGVR